MSIDDDILKKWKPEIYKDYSKLFKSKVDKGVYTQFLPYAGYLIKNYIPKNKNIRIIDLGCGIGGFTNEIFKAGYTNIQGVDVSEESVRAAQSNGVQNIILADIFLYLEAIDDSSIDVILCIDVLEHFNRDEAVKLLVDIKRVLKKDGRVIIHVPNAEGIFGSKIRYADFTHEMAYTQKSIAQILQYTGFGDVHCYEDKPLIHGFLSAIRRLLWITFTIPFRVLHAIETGGMNVKLSQNILVIATNNS